jgi:hypothetical protein
MTNQNLKEWSEANPDCTIHSLDTDETMYNGYANYHTWNVALWISNDETIYRHARSNKNLGYRKWAKRWIDEFGEYITGDGISWLSDDVDQDEMDLVLEEL